MTVLRTTSVYTLTVPDQPGLLDEMRRLCPATVTEVLISGGLAKLRFRTAGGDEQAIAVAHETLPAGGWTLRTGVGINSRPVLNTL